MQFDKKFSKNLILNHTETLDYKDGEVYRVKFWFTFYGQEFEAELTKKKVDDDFMSVEAEGPSELFDSFHSLLEDEYWDLMKECFLKHCEDERTN